jgi:hypothetical protein
VSCGYLSIDFIRLELDPFTLIKELPFMFNPLLEDTLRNFLESFNLEPDKLILSSTPFTLFTLEFMFWLDWEMLLFKFHLSVSGSYPWFILFL